MKYLMLLLLLCHCILLNGQNYSDYLGAGHSNGISITTSNGSDGIRTMDGDGLVAKKMEAARFLSQAGFGGDMADIDAIVNMGFEAWIDDQITKTPSDYLGTVTSIWNELYTTYINSGIPEEDIFGPYNPHFGYTWFDNLMKNDDQFRQRISYAWSQIFVVSVNSDLRDWAYCLGDYYDIFQEHGLGNFKDLLMEVTMHPAMGYYLSHFNNPKSDPQNNIHPDENYAREIMQLFTIGLYELNIDGSRKMSGGNPIPTYDNDDVKELAKVFTGLGPGGLQPWVDWTNQPYFGLDMYSADRTVPMIMFDSYHEPGSKSLLDGSYVIPAGQTGIEDIEDAVDFLFNHENVGPFISTRLIQRLVKSNPSPEYISRVSTVFNDNGQGVRGDITSVIKAILLDEEARSCDSTIEWNPGKLKEPILRLTSLLKAFPTLAPNNNYWHAGEDMLNRTGQKPIGSPTVFNFYLPDFQPNGPILDQGLVAPEFQILNSHTSVGYINKVHDWTLWNYILYDWEDDTLFGENTISLDDTYLSNLLTNEGIESFLNEMDILLGYGQLTEDTREQIRSAAEQLNWSTYDDITIMLYTLLISPDFVIDK